MELPHLGQHCSEESCNRLDFLPVKCDACKKIFCCNHMTYAQHNCSSAHQKNVQVPVCPLCNKPVPIPRGTLPDIAVGRHIDNDCRFDRAQERKNAVFTNKCSLKGCKTKEIVPFVCADCHENFCLKHRHVGDHKCTVTARRRMTNETSVNGQRQNQNRLRNQKSLISRVQGSMSEDEALARALQKSMEDERKVRQQTENHRGPSCLVS